VFINTELGMKSEELDRKLKREKVEVCLKCESVGRFVECEEFVEVEDEAWIVRKI